MTCPKCNAIMTNDRFGYFCANCCYGVFPDKNGNLLMELELKQ